MPAASSNCDTIVTYVLLEGSLLRLVLIGRMLICWPLITVTIVTTMLRERLSSTWAPPKVPNVRRLFASDASSTHLATHRALPANPLLQTEGAELSRQIEYALALQMPPFSSRHFHASYFQ